MANPAFTGPQRTALYQALVEIGWIAPLQGPFIGGRQPYAPRKLPPSMLSVDSPPAYLPEILVLPPEDPTVYFRAQRWPADKIIVSVDNPPTQDDERAAVLDAIYNAWNAPAWPMPQSPRKVAATIVTATTSTADWFSQGVGTATFVGAASDTADWNSVAIGAAAWVGSAIDAVDWNAIGSGTAAWVGAFLSNTAPKTAFQEHVILAWQPPSILPQRLRFAPISQAVSSSADWSSTGVGTATFVGQATDTADWMSAGVAVATFNGQAVDAADWNSVGVGAASWEGSFSAPSIASGDWFSAGTSTAAFSSFRPSTVTRDGWRVRAQQQKRRRRKDEDELMQIAAAVLPYIHGRNGRSVRIVL